MSFSRIFGSEFLKIWNSVFWFRTNKKPVFEALNGDIFLTPLLEPKYTHVGFNFTPVQVCQYKWQKEKPHCSAQKKIKIDGATSFALGCIDSLNSTNFI